MIAMQPVVEVYAPHGFDLWPVAGTGAEPYAFLPLHGGMTAAEVGAAVRRIAEYNEDEPEDGPIQGDPLHAFLYGLLNGEDLITPGGFRVTDSATGVVFDPGCCNGLEEWRDWLTVVDGGSAGFGHGPAPLAEHLGATVRLTVDTEVDDGPVIELPAAGLGALVAGAERDLADFLRLVTAWAAEHLPARHAAPVATAVGIAIGLGEGSWPAS